MRIVGGTETLSAFDLDDHLAVHDHVETELANHDAVVADIDTNFTMYDETFASHRMGKRPLINGLGEAVAERAVHVEERLDDAARRFAGNQRWWSDGIHAVP